MDALRNFIRGKVAAKDGLNTSFSRRSSLSQGSTLVRGNSMALTTSLMEMNESVEERHNSLLYQYEEQSSSGLTTNVWDSVQVDKRPDPDRIQELFELFMVCTALGMFAMKPFYHAVHEIGGDRDQ